MHLRFALILLIVFASLTQASRANLVANERVFSLQSDNGGTINILFGYSQYARATLLLVPGRDGHLDLSTYGIGNGSDDVLVRSRLLFQSAGFNYAIIDAPSYRTELDPNYRTSSVHAAELNQVAAWLKQITGNYVWAVGSDQATYSVANAAINSNYYAIDGVIMLSPLTNPPPDWFASRRYPEAVASMRLYEINVPVLAITHARDRCNMSPPKGVDLIMRRLERSNKPQRMMVTAGSTSYSEPCSALSPHGFYGAEQEVVNVIRNFIG